MKAIQVHQFGAPEVLQLEEVPNPIPQAGQVLIQVHAAGANPLDTYLRAGVKVGDYTTPFPWTPGNDAAGTVVTIGTGVTRVNVGDRVYAQPLTGSYAEFILGDEAQVHLIPNNISFAQATCINIACRTAYYSLFELAAAQSGQTVLVHGASGSVGNAAVQLAVDAGLKVIGTAGSEAGVQLVRDLGAEHVFNHQQPDYLGQIQAVANSVDIILEMAASKNLPKDINLIKPGGRIIVIGGSNPVEIAPVSVIGSGIYIIGVRLSLIDQPLNQKIHTVLYHKLQAGVLRPIVDQEIPLAQAPRAHYELEKSGSLGKICLIP